MPKHKSVLRRIVDSKTFDCMLIKRLLSAVVGFSVGYAYYAMIFSHAFRPEEKEYSDMVKWGVLGTSAIGSFLSTQCCCIAALCIPTLSARSGRSVIQAALFTWILAGPLTNVFYHTTESIRSISCVSELQNNQSRLMISLMTAPIRKGLGLIVDESDSLPKSEKELENHVNDLRVQLLTTAFGKKKANKMLQEEERVEQEAKKEQEEKSKNSTTRKKQRKKRGTLEDQIAQLKEEYENETVKAPPPAEVDVAGNMREETNRICHEIFQKAYDSCCLLAVKTWEVCMATVKIPIVKHIICQIVWWNQGDKCNDKILGKRDKKCGEKLDIDDDAVNLNYTVISQAVKNINTDFKMGIYWMPPDFNEHSALMTVEEITSTVKDDYMWRMAIMEICVTVARKLMAVTVILVLKATDNENDWLVSVLLLQGRYRRPKKDFSQGKRHLLPLTRLEGKYVIRPSDTRFSTAEKKSMLFKIIALVLQCLFVTIIFIYDGILYFVMDLVRRSAKSDYHIVGRHMLQANIKGNGTVSDLMRILFSGFIVNDHQLNATGSNEHCLPKPKKLEYDYVKWTVTGYAMLAILICVEGYFLRLRSIICSTFFPRREKRRIIHLYNELLRERKLQIQSVRRTILKLCLTKRLNQKYGFLEAVRIRFPNVGEFLALFGLGKLRCLVCETPEGRNSTLWRCSDVKCGMLYCNICWIEVNEMCWACNSNRGVEKALPNKPKTDPPPPPAVDQQLANVDEATNLVHSEEDDSDL